MKRVIIALTMLSLAVTVAAVSSVTLDKNIKSIIFDIHNLQNNLNEYETQKIKSQTVSISNKWIKTEKILKLVSIRDKFSDISEKFKHLSSADTTDKKELSKILSEITVMLEMYLSSDDAVLENIF